MLETKDIDLNLIDQNADQPRKFFDNEKIEALKKSIEQDGLLQPIVVRPMQDGRYQLIAGECRYRALKELGHTTVPSVVLEADDSKALDLALLENEVRSELTPLEKAEAIEEYKARHSSTYEEIAQILGMKPSNVSNITSLNRLDDKIKSKIREQPSNYPLRALMTIARIDDPKKQKIAFSALKSRISNAGKEKALDKTKQLIQQANRDVKNLKELKANDFTEHEKETEALSQNLANLLESFFSSDFNALKLDQLKETIRKISTKISKKKSTEAKSAP